MAEAISHICRLRGAVGALDSQQAEWSQGWGVSERPKELRRGASRERLVALPRSALSALKGARPVLLLLSQALQVRPVRSGVLSEARLFIPLFVCSGHALQPEPRYITGSCTPVPHPGARRPDEPPGRAALDTVPMERASVCAPSVLRFRMGPVGARQLE
ncbi:hypothetical protein AAFF_G00226850 [Aldrovandia affinis]|uniref:Uncharacterized protein n=1 Tax=Aldrovandia affinis TaxID=143900 RepID=A0AAD7TBD2_9TELE|nr:hypothetical protein AAFF_G00226850 [Aldrovandia affinis]